MHRRAHYFRYNEEDNPLYIPKTSVINECPFKEPTYTTILLDNLTYISSTNNEKHLFILLLHLKCKAPKRECLHHRTGNFRIRLKMTCSSLQSCQSHNFLQNCTKVLCIYVVMAKKINNGIPQECEFAQCSKLNYFQLQRFAQVHTYLKGMKRDHPNLKAG